MSVSKIVRASKVITLVAPLAVLLSANPALGNAHGRGGACKADIQQFCPDITPGPGAFRAYQQCLQDHADQLSAACQQQRSQWQVKMQEILQACAAETSPGGVCADAGSDPRAIFTCLHQNRHSLSPQCQAQLPHRRHHHGDKGSAPAS